jgi:hypothetical protein
MVRRQARKIPSVVVAQKPPQNNADAQQRVGEGGERRNGAGDRSSVYIDVDQCPENLLPSVEWESYYLQVGLLGGCSAAGVRRKVPRRISMTTGYTCAVL